MWTLLALLSLPAAMATDPAAAPTAPEQIALDFVAAAQTWTGTPYLWEGRGTQRLPGMDCLGLLFRAHGAVTSTPWHHYAVNPSELVASGRLGRPVPGLEGIRRDAVTSASLVTGDVLYFLLAEYEIPDAPLWIEDGVRYWPWHTGLYVGGGSVLQAEPGSTVRARGLHEISFDALYVTRLSSAAPEELRKTPCCTPSPSPTTAPSAN